mmetsp:Transcript_97434/g.260039  ORF Transcript_97434/g.260039 Transcript_97434/m.260039 type:complete len:660 (+) Transcript_97434:50-2029(+)
MSNFRDTFTKDDKKDPPLNYDDSAFMFFALTMLCVVTVPWTIIYIRGLFSSDQQDNQKTKAGSKLRNCAASTAQKHIAEAKEKSAMQSRVGNGKMIRGGILCVLWVLIFILWGTVSNAEMNVQGFDPYAILEIPLGSEEGFIKKAYRKMSKKFHPDLNPNDPLAQAKFIQITKAYAALTDDVARTNFEKYGNPDGPVQMKLGIGLPRFLLEDENQLMILCIFFLILLFIVPLGAICYYQSQKQYAGNGVLMETLRYLGQYINDQSPTFGMQKGPELLACSAEARINIKIRVTDEEDMRIIDRDVVQHKKLHERVERAFPIVRKNHRLILAHMQRMHKLMSPALIQDLRVLLKHSRLVTRSMIEIACMHEWFACTCSMIEFRRSLVQALDYKDSSLLQIPHFDQNNVKLCEKARPKAIKDLQGFLDDDRPIDNSKPGLKDFTDEQILDVKAFVDHVSNLELKWTAETEGEDCIVESDVVTVTTKLIRKNLEDGEAMGPVHAPFYAEPKYEEWWVFMTDPQQNRIMCFERVLSAEKEMEVKMRLQVGPGRTGKHTYVVHALSDSFAGIDRKAEITFEVKSQKEVARKVFVHQEDLELDMQPTFFQSMMGIGPQEEDSSDEEDERPRKPAATAPKAQPKAQPKVEEVESSGSGSDDDSDSES